MENFDELKSIWQQARPTRTVDTEKAIKLVESFGKKERFKAILVYVMMSIAFIVIACVAFSYPSQLVITKIGFGCVLVAIASAILFINNMVRTLSVRVNTMDNNKIYLIRLKAFESRLAFIHSTGISIYIFLLSSGLALAMYEITRRNFIFAVGAYVVTSAWIALIWFYFRPNIVKKEKQKLKEVINRLEEIAKQLE
jgi:hypothetical protein